MSWSRRSDTCTSSGVRPPRVVVALESSLFVFVLSGTWGWCPRCSPCWWVVVCVVVVVVVIVVVGVVVLMYVVIEVVLVVVLVVYPVVIVVGCD